MSRKKVLAFTFLLAALALASCSGPLKSGGGGGGGGGGGTATVSFTLIADTLPAHPSLISFKVSVNTVTLTPTTGTAQTLTPATPVLDLMRFESDTAFLGSIPKVPAGTYTVQVSFSNPEIAFFNDSGSTITVGSTMCANMAVCSATLTATGSPTIASFTVTVAASVNQGIELDFKLANAISLSNGTLTVNFTPSAPNPGVLTAFTLPRQNANLSTGQLELVEDFTGVVSLSGNNVTLTSPVRGTLTAVNSSSSFFDASPDGTICPTPATFSCVKAGQVASLDVFLNSDGTIALKEFEPLLAAQQDLVEGIVFQITQGALTQFGIVVTDEIQAATNSLIGGLKTGDFLTVNIPTATVKPFLVDTKGLAVSPVALNLFR
ncbi:MAG TPA: hypothetical protein VNB49_10975, partial [Candidatus Dormibacteraeota bacterium]|nr:hypothetical protein [Candidatus Dormibacteraeota bacterium]